MKVLDQENGIDASLSNKTVLAKKYLLMANFFVETNRLEPFVAVYFVVLKGWNPLNIGIISVVMNVVSILFQIPVGDFLDKTPYKKTVTVIALLVASITTACVGWTENFWVVLVAKAIEGVAAVIFLPALTTFVFGICTVTEEIPRFIATNEVSNKIGSTLFTLCCGLITYFLYPDIASMFYLLGAGGVTAAFFIALIPSSAIDMDRARQLRREAVGEGESDTEDEELVEDMSEVVSYSAVLKDRKILAFAVATFLYHFANAGVVPLLVQYVAIGNERTSMVFTSASLLTFYFFQGITAQVLRSIIEKVAPKNLLIAAHFVLIIRCTMIISMIQWWDNEYMLIATQVLDGVGAGIYDTLLPLMVSLLTDGTGRFGFTYSLILTCWRLGHGASFLLGEAIVHAVSYQAAFLTFVGIAIFSLLWLVILVDHPPLLANKIQRFHPFFDEEMMKVAFRKRVLAYMKEIGGEFSIDGLHDVFLSIDEIDKNGTLEKNEMALFLEKLSDSSNLESAEINHIDLDALFRAIDTNGNGKIEFAEFVNYLKEAEQYALSIASIASIAGA